MAYELIETVELASSASAIEFASIPQDATDLYLVLSARSSSGSISDVRINFNDDTSSNYSYTYVRAYNESPSSQNSSGQTTFTIGYAAGPNNGADTFGWIDLYISNYADGSPTSMSNNSGVIGSNDRLTQFQSARWNVSSGITKITLSCSDFVQYTSASLYKITAA